MLLTTTGADFSELQRTKMARTPMIVICVLPVLGRTRKIYEQQEPYQKKPKQKVWVKVHWREKRKGASFLSVLVQLIFY